MWMWLLLLAISLEGAVKLGVDCFFEENRWQSLQGKKVGIITNQTGVNSDLVSTVDLFLTQAKGVEVVALFAPEHGILGQAHASEWIDSKASGKQGILVHSLYGKVRRPTDAMLQNIDVLIYDIQDIGVRSYTYTTTLFYVMEEAAKKKIPLIVLDRPNPINGLTVDGPMLQETWRSYIGYVNVPYCHGMTIGELARYFNAKYQIGCVLEVIPMQGWKRGMSYADTGLYWIPTSPNIPEADTPLFCASTGIFGELSVVNIGIGFTLPFKVVGAPWIKAEEFAQQLNSQKLPGVKFHPFHYRPFYGLYKDQDCEGVKIIVTNTKSYRPLAVQYILMGILKNLYPQEMKKRLAASGKARQEMFCKASGNSEMWGVLTQEKYIAWKLILYQKQEREAFCEERKAFLLYPR